MTVESISLELVELIAEKVGTDNLSLYSRKLLN